MSEERDAADGEDLSILDELLEPELDEDEAEETPEGDEQEEEQQPQEQRRPSSRQRAILRMRERLKREEDENRRLRDQLLTQTRTPPPQVDPYRRAEEERQEAERVAQMMPHEQAQFYARRTEQNFQQQLMRQNLETRDLIDRQLFQSLCAQEPMANRLSTEVENTLNQARQQGMNPTREAIYNLLVGQEVRTRAKKQTEKQRKNGRAQIERQTTQPGGTRSTAAGGRSRAAANPDVGLEDRLRKVTVGDVW
jgi:hypothetical protein